MGRHAAADPTGLPFVGACAEFLAPATLEDSLEVRAWVTHVGRTSFTIRNEVVRVGEKPALLVRGQERHVRVTRDEENATHPKELTLRTRQCPLSASTRR